MDVICALLLCVLHRLSFTSVVFDFNASLIDVAPASPMVFTMGDTEHKSVKKPLC